MRHQKNKADTNGPSARTASLWRIMVILLAVTTVGVVGLTVKKYIDTRRHVSSAVIRQLTIQAEARLAAFIQPVMTTMVIIKRWAASSPSVSSLNI